jgi:peptide chain release factor 3
MDPRHRDRNAFIRICSGEFTRGMKVTNARTGKPLTLNYASGSFGRQRETLEEAFPGDIVGVVNAADLQVGDTVFMGEPIRYPPLPPGPEHFIQIRNANAQKHKRFPGALATCRDCDHVLTQDGGRDPMPILEESAGSSSKWHWAQGTNSASGQPRRELEARPQDRRGQRRDRRASPN